MYKINGRKVTREEFCAEAVGFKAGDVFQAHAGMQPFQSPIDGKMVNNTDDLVAHNREHDVYQLGDDQKRKRDASAQLKREEALDTGV